MKMEGTNLKKIVFSDAGVDKALIGEVIEEDTFFLSVRAKDGTFFKIGKARIVFVRDVTGAK